MKQLNIKTIPTKIWTAFTFLFIISGCSDTLDPLERGWVDDEQLWKNISYTHAVLDQVYDNIQDDWVDQIGISNDYYTDNAVHNSTESIYATGGGSSSYYPIGEWSFAYTNILQINYYLENGLDVHFTGSDDELDSIAKARYYGEAHFLRAWNESLLLKEYAGPVDAAGQQIMGYPIVKKVYENDEYANLTRNTYDECVQSIIDDLDTAYIYLPQSYLNGISVYDEEFRHGRATQKAALALKARVLLYAASEAYNPTNNNQKWIDAAIAAYRAIQEDGGFQTLEAYGEFDHTASEDHYWRTGYSASSSTLENTHFPPSRYGKGECNPSQNLIDAFPMANGLPADLNDPNYISNPYEGRDARFYHFIAYNGDPMFGNFDPVETFVDGADYNGVLRNNATRTGYYMKRFLSNIAVGNDPRKLDGETTSSQKFAVLLDREELYLNFAEAVNEIAGSDPKTALNEWGINHSAWMPY
ncbi:RagB/SusD family nutrient uptake outer membrane protein [Saccharicrinis fermentans]|uniref:SusD family protein n=1 Tax=Saccharicrinis fermentans DSM 9555 = JCM 21142 TaxID=869213 RepID=W7Y5F7_9BACT|nr:RagB/SusD family nutrient uptake outer membrane protein [Saccharicrinis fermentans]GAF03332.1 SusD family protein [Saccharicrinis fermentans DSM 9555 = JCM 21142]